MNKLTKFVLLFAALATFSCSDDDSDNNNEGTYIRFTEGGEQYDLENVATATSLSTAITAMEGNDDAMRRITLFIPNDATEGSHTITDSPSDATAYGAVYDKGDVTVIGTDGILVITEITDDHVKGTFGFTGETDGTTYTITDGTFRAER